MFGYRFNILSIPLFLLGGGFLAMLEQQDVLLYVIGAAVTSLVLVIKWRSKDV